MASTEEEPNTAEGVFFIVCFMAFIMLGTYLFAGYVIWAHEQTAQHCIQVGNVWEADNCLIHNN